jgi:hypothetical protein
VSYLIRNIQGYIRFNFIAKYNLVPPIADWQYSVKDSSNNKLEYTAEQNLFQFVISNNRNNPEI